MKMNNILKQAQRMQAQMAKAQAELADERVVGNAGGGMVKVTVNGQGDILEVKIDPEVVNPDDVDMLEDLVLAAVADAVKKSRELAQSKLGGISGGLGNMMGLNF